MAALMHGAYEKKGKGMESLKMRTLRRCKQPADLDGSANYSKSCSVVYRRQWKFAQIRGYFSHGAMVSLMQGAYEKKGKGVESLKMQTMRRCKKPTDLDGSANSSESLTLCSAANRNVRKLGATYPTVQLLH